MGVVVLVMCTKLHMILPPNEDHSISCLPNLLPVIYSTRLSAPLGRLSLVAPLWPNSELNFRHTDTGHSSLLK